MDENKYGDSKIFTSSSAKDSRENNLEGFPIVSNKGEEDLAHFSSCLDLSKYPLSPRFVNTTPIRQQSGFSIRYKTVSSSPPSNKISKLVSSPRTIGSKACSAFTSITEDKTTFSNSNGKESTLPSRLDQRKTRSSPYSSCVLMSEICAYNSSEKDINKRSSNIQLSCETVITAKKIYDDEDDVSSMGSQSDDDDDFFLLSPSKKCAHNLCLDSHRSKVVSVPHLRQRGAMIEEDSSDLMHSYISSHRSPQVMSSTKKFMLKPKASLMGRASRNQLPKLFPSPAIGLDGRKRSRSPCPFPIA